MGTSASASTVAGQSSEVKIETLKPPRPSGAPEQWKLQKTIENLDHYPQVLDYLMKERGFNRATIDAYKVGAGTFRFLDDATQKWVDHQCVTFPWLQRVPKPKAEESKEKRRSSTKKESQSVAKQEETSSTEQKTTDNATSGEKADDKKDNKLEKKDEEYEYGLVRMKYRPVVQKTFRLDPTGGMWGLFGWHLIPPDATEIVLTVL